MSSLDRLIKLAKKTGDRLIVHNPADETDVVIMDVNDYENLFDAKQDGLTSSQDVRGLSERELLNQINRDIAIWRANDKLESECEEDMFDFENNTADWHSAGSVIEITPPFTEARRTDEAGKEENPSKGLILDDEPVFYEEPI